MISSSHLLKRTKRVWYFSLFNKMIFIFIFIFLVFLILLWIVCVTFFFSFYESYLNVFVSYAKQFNN